MLDVWGSSENTSDQALKKEKENQINAIFTFYFIFSMEVSILPIFS